MATIETIQIHPAIGIAQVGNGPTEFLGLDNDYGPGGIYQRVGIFPRSVKTHHVPNGCSGRGYNFARLQLRMIIKL